MNSPSDDSLQFHFDPPEGSNVPNIPSAQMSGNWSGDELAEEAEFRARLLPKKTIQLAVSGRVLISDIERQIIDTSGFQRLRGIRQLGAACQVYPTALHTRFDHSIGTLGVVCEMISAIRANEHNRPEERRITRKEETLARLYALLHDVPHVPFGHTIEDELGILERHDKNEARILHFLGPNSAIGKIVSGAYGKDFLNLLLDIYRWDEKPGATCKIPEELVFVHDLVSNTVCADLLDYLQRDNYFCNLGIRMDYHFLNYLYIHKEAKTGYKRVFVRLWKQEGRPRRDVLTDLCRLLQARYLVAERVYFHRAKITAGTMLGRAIQEAAAKNEVTEEKIREHGDDTLIYELSRSSSPLAKELALKYKRRELYQCAREFGSEDLDRAQAQSHRDNQVKMLFAKIGRAEKRKEFEDYLAACVGAPDGSLLLYAPEKKMNMKQAEMKVFWSGETIAFKDVNDPIVRALLDSTLAMHKRLWSVRLLADRSLTESQVNLAIKIVEDEFFRSATDAESERKTTARKIVEHHLIAKHPEIKFSEQERKAKVEAAAEELLAAHYNANNLRTVIDKSLKSNFL